MLAKKDTASGFGEVIVKCENCLNWKHDPTNRTDKEMYLLGYKPCIRDRNGNFKHSTFKCEKYEVKK